VNLSYFTLRRLTDDLQQLVASRVERAVLTPSNGLALSFGRGSDRRSHLLFSASRTQGRACLIPDAPEAGSNRPPWLDRHLEGAILRRLEQTPYERIITLHFERRDRLGDTFRTRLIVELLGRNANLIVLNPDTDRIIDALRPIKGDGRRILPGGSYAPPPPQDRVHPNDLTLVTLATALTDHETAVGALCGVVAGMDPLTAEEILHRSGASLETTLTLIKDFASKPPFASQVSVLLSDRGGKRVTPFDLSHVDDAEVATYPDISAAIEAAVEGEQKQTTAKGRAKDLQRLLGRRIKSVRSRCTKIERDIEAAGDADHLERIGSLILSQLDAVSANTPSVTLRDLYADGEPDIEIRLNPKLTPVDNGHDYIRRSKKLAKSLPILRRRLSQSQTESKDLEDRVGELSRVKNEADFEAMHQRLIADRLVRPPKQRPQQGRKQAPGEIHPRRYLTSDGWEVWVGRNDTENDRISRVVPKNDIWMHAQGCPGSHVVLKRKTPKAVPTRIALEEAAALAAYWSKARGSRTVPVNYTEARYVQKPRGAPPGMVTIQNEKTIFVHPREIRKADE
jgi:predicted ribosome quality control (RQC) complex YloA/Tae2 family protein